MTDHRGPFCIISSAMVSAKHFAHTECIDSACVISKHNVTLNCY